MARLSTMRLWWRRSRVFALALGAYLAFSSGIGTAQISPEEHAKHHPGEAPPPAGSPGASSTPSPAGVGGPPGGMPDMGKMMESMGKVPAKDLYPTLMGLPNLPPEKRAEVEVQARTRMTEGATTMAQAAGKLAAASSSGNYSEMQSAELELRQGLSDFDTGLAALQALDEGQAPQQVALRWFKTQMNLVPVAGHTMPERTIFGLSFLHFFVMVLLIAFALAMVAMYFFKMRRAAALFGRLDSDSGSPPPGASPPLAGTPGPSSPGAPPAGKTPPPGGAPPPAVPPSPATPAAGTPPASATSSAVPPPAAGGSPASPATPPVSEATSAAPVTANWRGQLRVGSIVTETPSVKTLRLQPSSNDRFLPFRFVPGQFLNVAFWIGGARMNRSYSISSSPTQREYVELTVRREPRGAVSRHIDDLLKVGDQIEAGGPVGKFTFTGTEADSIVLIAGGVGITPMMSITRYLTERSWPGDIFFIYVCRTPADFIFADEVAALQRRNSKLRVAVTISKAEGTDWKGPRGRITKELLTQTVPNLTSRRIHLCGPPSMMDSAKAILTELGVAPDQVKTELFGLTKPTPAAAGTSLKPTAPATGPLVTFSKNNKSAKIHVDLQAGDSPPKQSILELSEELGIGIEFSCRVGTCGVCKVKMTSGEVDMAVQDALDADDKTNGIILACQAKPKSEVTVEA